MRILRKGKGLLETFKCKLGYHEWVAVHWAEFKQRPRRAIFSKKGGRRKDMKTKKVEVVKDRRSDGIALEISHNGWQITAIILMI